MDNTFHTAPKSAFINKIVFLLLSLPLGIIYFTLIVTGLSLGMGTLVIWIGLPILFVVFFLVHALAGVERRMVNNLLHIPIFYHVPTLQAPDQGFFKRFGKMLSNPYTWTSTIYMLLKLPLGIFSFTLTITFLSISLALTLMPLAYFINLLVNIILLANGIVASGMIIPHFIEIHSTFDLVMFARTFIGIPLGILFWIITRYTIDALALATGELARAMLGPGEVIVAQPQQDTYYYTTRPQQNQHDFMPPMEQVQRANLD